MKMIDPTAMSRFTALREAAGKIDHLVPHVRLMEQPPHESRNTTSVALEFPTPLVVLNSTIRQALSFLFSACDTVQTDKTDAVSASLSPFPGCGSRRTRNKPPLRFRKAVLRQAPRVACALHFRCAAPPHGSLPFCGGGPANNWHAHRHGHGLHSKRPHACQWAHGCARCFLIMQVSCAPIVRGWLHLHGIHFKSHMDGGRPFVSAPRSPLTRMCRKAPAFR